MMDEKQVSIINLSEREFKKLIHLAVEQALLHSPELKKMEQGSEIKWLTRKEAAKYLELALPTLDKHTKEGKISAHRIGRKKYYSLQALNEAVFKLKIK